MSTPCFSHFYGADILRVSTCYWCKNTKGTAKFFMVGVGLLFHWNSICPSSHHIIQLRVRGKLFMWVTPAGLNLWLEASSVLGRWVLCTQILEPPLQKFPCIASEKGLWKWGPMNALFFQNRLENRRTPSGRKSMNKQNCPLSHVTSSNATAAQLDNFVLIQIRDVELNVLPSFCQLWGLWRRKPQKKKKSTNCVFQIMWNRRQA